MEEVAKESEENGKNVIASAEENSYLKKILDFEEFSLIPNKIVEKIENSLQQSFDEFLTSKALYETFKFRHEEEINKLNKNYEEKEKALEDTTLKLNLAQSSIKELQEKLVDAQSSVQQLQEKNKQLQHDWQDFKTQRDQIIDEKESLLQMVERRNAEISNLKIDLNEAKKQLQAAVKAKLVALENSEEVESLKISLTYKEKRLEQESNLIKSQLQAITEELNKQTSELTKVKRENCTKFIALEEEIAQKTQQLKIAQDTAADLKDSNDKLTQKVESLLEKLVEQRNSTDLMYDNFQQELQAQSKLAQLYKDLSEENDTKTEKLTNAINELQQLLKAASDQYGELETKQKQMILQHEEEILQKNECIMLLKKELEDANELLKLSKEENLETAIASLSPSAAAASRLIKSGMTLTQIYTQYASVSEQLLLEKEENRKLSLYVNTILNEIEEKAPILKQQKIDYENALNNVESLTKQLDDLIVELKILEEECSEAKKNSGFFKRENDRLKKEVTDLSRQVCYLIKSVEEARGGIVSDLESSQVSFDGSKCSAQQIISKKLVTFGSIQDLQENNQKLLALVRQLSDKQEAVEKVSATEFYELKEKEEKLQIKVSELMDDMNRQSKMLDLIKNQSLMYKKLYDQSLRGEVPEQSVKMLESSEKTSGVITSTPKKSSVDNNSCEFQELAKKLEESKKENKELENKIDKYKSELSKVNKQFQEEIQSLRKEINDLIYKNSKLVAQAEFHVEKSKVMETNIKTLKNQIQALEERNKMLSEISAKHEQSTVHLNQEVLQLQSKLSKAEVAVENLKQENFLLKTAEARLLKENECYSREKHSHSLLMSNLDAIKATFERSEEEGKLRLEAQLSDAIKECTVLRNALKEEKNRFKELAASLERQTAVAKERMLEEKKIADKAQEDLEQVKNELEMKNEKIEELVMKIRELNNLPTKSVIETVSTNLDESTKRNKELENKIKDLEHEISRLELQLAASKTHCSQYCEMAESLEKQLNEANENHENFRGLMTAKIEDSFKRENDWKEKYEKLEKKYETISNKQKFCTEELNAKLATSSTELKCTNTELINLRNELSSTELELKKAKDTINSLSKSLEEAETKYSNEVVLHSSDIQTLSSVKKELSGALKRIAQLEMEKDDAKEALQLKSASWNEKEKKAMEEVKELNNRLSELDEQNQVLHEHIQELGNQVAILQCRVSDGNKKPIEESALNESTELNSKAQDQLLKVIKFLRQEKNLSITRSEILQAENVRLRTQLAIVTKQLDEAKATLKKSEESSDVTAKASAKHAELLRKIDTLNAITDSNRILREERDKLQEEIKNIKKQLEEAQTKVEPLELEIKNINTKVEELTTENQALLIDLAKWKQRVERSTKGTPEDWRRLTNERENLAKQWQMEKNNNEKLEDELKKLKQEKTSLNEQIVQIQKSLQNETNEIKRLTEECNSFKQQFIKSSEALNTTKNQLNKVIEESAKLSKEVEAREVIINDLKTKEEKLKRLCNKYRKQYEVLLKTFEDEKKAREEEAKKTNEEMASKPISVQEDEKEKLREEGRTEIRNEFTIRLTESEARYSEKIKDLEADVRSAQEESENLRKDNENLKTSINEKEERVKTVMKSARTKIAQLSEQKKNLELELEQMKGQKETPRDESDSKINSLKVLYESKISEIEKERSAQVAEKDQEKERLNTQIKALNQKINQMQRLFEKQLGTKPSTSSRTPDKSSMEPPTANIKPMAGSSSSPRKEKQITGPVGPCWRSGNETPFASIRPTISMQARTLAVLPTSQTSNNQAPTSQSTPVVVLPQQQVVHTTGNSGEVMSSSPTSSHTDYMPATSSATPTRQVVVAPPLSVGPHTGSDAQSTQEMEAEANDNEIQQQTSQQSQSSVQQQMQTVAMVMPRERVDQQPISTATTQGNQQQNVDQGFGIAYSQANSSNTVTTTQAGLKRTRDVEGDSSTSLEREDVSKVLPQSKRVRIAIAGNQAEVFHHQVTHSEGIEVEYQVPTSSQRDQEDDNLIMIDSDDEGNADEGDVECAEDEHEFEEDNGGFEVSYSRDGQEIGLTTYDEGPDIDEENVTDQDNNEVEVVDDGSEVPNQSGSSRNEVGGDENASQSSLNAAVPVASSIESANQEPSLQQSAEATSSGPANSETGNNLLMVGHAASSLGSQSYRGRNAPLLNRQQQSQLILPQNYEEYGDDGIVPSTPTLFIPRRSDGFGEAVSSPQIPHQGRFTFSDPSASTTRSGILPVSGENSEDSIHLEEPGTGRSVPTTPLQVSPQELPAGETISEVGQSSSSAAHAEGDESDVVLNIPDIVVTITEDDDHCETPPPELSESAGEDEEEPIEKEDISEDEPEVINLEEENDGVTSEGEKPLSAIGEIEEGREAEASEPFDSVNTKRQISRIGGSMRRTMRVVFPRRSQARRPTPIVWNEPGSSSGTSGAVGSAIPSILRTNIPPERALNPELSRAGFRGRMQRARKWR